MRCLVLMLALALLAGCGDRDPPSWSLQPGETFDSDVTGQAQGDQLDPDLSWGGYPSGSTTPAQIVLGEFSDPTGARGVNALLIMQGTTTCPACQRAGSELPNRLAGGWDALGVAVLDLLIAGSGGLPATVDDAARWKDQFGATWGVGVDPAFTFAKKGTNLLPVYVLVNPRTLRVETRLEGYQADLSFVDAMAQANQP